MHRFPALGSPPFVEHLKFLWNVHAEQRLTCRCPSLDTLDECLANLFDLVFCQSVAIGFVGIVVPHLLRLAIGPSHRFLLPASALGGAALLLLADSFARTVAAPAELPIGVVTALIGAPVFLFLLLGRGGFSMRNMS